MANSFASPAPIYVGDDDASTIIPPLSLPSTRSMSPSPRPRSAALGRRAPSPLLYPPPGSPGRPRSRAEARGSPSPRSASAGPSTARSVAAASEPAPPTPRKKKESRLLRTEIKGVVTNLTKQHRRVDNARAVVQGTMRMLQVVAADAAKRLGQNPYLVKRSVGGPDETHAPLVSGQLVPDVAWSSGKPEKVIVEAVSKLGQSSLSSLSMLAIHEEAMLTHVGLLEEIIGDLNHHYECHDFQINEMAHNPTTSPTRPLQGALTHTHPHHLCGHHRTDTSSNEKRYGEPYSQRFIEKSRNGE